MSKACTRISSIADNFLRVVSSSGLAGIEARIYRQFDAKIKLETSLD